MNRFIGSFVLLWVFLLPFFSGRKAFAQQDAYHQSALFKDKKPYRIYLPTGYDQSEKRYPVIYFFHGNFGTHEFELKGINQLVNDRQVILVAWNGRSVASDRRPYNIGDRADVKYQIQFKDYMPELIHHIDSVYRTIPGRESRGLMGHSMGGFMSFVLAAKHPQLVGTAVNMKGAPEFFMGYPENNTLYSLRFMFKDLYGVRLRFHNSTVDQLVHLNNEVNHGAIREHGLDYTYQVYPGGHDYTEKEFADAFNFVANSFKKTFETPSRWHHSDSYPDFSVWGYSVISNLERPGFIDLAGVTKGGMQIRTRQWQPDGPLIPDVQIRVTTAPVYKPATFYTLFDYNETQDVKNISTVKSDAAGRISFSVNHENHQIGIHRKNDAPELVFIEHRVNDHGLFLDHHKESKLNLRLLNRGPIVAKGIKLTLRTTADGVSIANQTVELDDIPAGEIKWSPDLLVTAANKPTTDGSPFRIRFNLTMTDHRGRIWQDEFDCPVFYDVPEFTKLGIDDWDSEIFGSGNGNNIPEAGETIMVYQSSHRTRLYFDDPYIRDERLHTDLHPDTWGGDGFSLSSLIHISKDCPIGREIKFLACYEEKEWQTIKRNVTWGTFTLVIGKPREN